MYSLNINFLKDRPEYQTARATKTTGSKGAAGSGRLLVILGAIVGVMVPAAVGGFYGYLAWQMGGLETNQLKLDQDLADLEAELKKAEQAQAEMKAIDDLTQGLVGVFNKVKSWSAVMSDLRDRLPQDVQLLSIKEAENPEAKAAASTGASAVSSGPPPPKQIITIEGYANSVEGVGSLLLLLQKSPFLDPAVTRLVNSELVDNPAQIVQSTQEVQEGIAYVLNAPPPTGTAGAQVKIVVPKVIKYQIQSAYTQKTAEDLLQVLDRSGSSGLVVRIETIRRILAEQGKAPTMNAPTPAPANGTQPEEKTNNGV